MPNETLIQMVRHGQTDWNREGRFQGYSDVPLNETGVEQARLVGLYLKHLKFDHCFASDLSRARHTADAIVNVCGTPLTLDESLREANKGELEGKFTNRVTGMLGDESGYYDVHSVDVRPPGGESVIDIEKRCRQFLERYSLTCAGAGWNRVLIVAHSGSLRVLLATLLGLPIEASRVFRLENCSVTTVQLRHEAPPLLVEYNEQRHLQKSQERQRSGARGS